MSVNPCDNDNIVLVDDKEPHSLWPMFADAPAGRRMVHGEADRAACLDYIEHNGTDLLPKSLRKKLAAG